MKKIFTIVLTFYLTLTCLINFMACSGGNVDNNNADNNSSHSHTYENTWTQTETHHYKKATCKHKSEYKDYAIHNYGTDLYICDTCGYVNENLKPTENNVKSYINSKLLINAIRQESDDNNIKIVVENHKESILLDELFSYSPNHITEIYSLNGSNIDYAKKEISLSVGYNNFQILFKNLSDYTETTFNIKIFRDCGIITRKITRYSLRKEYVQTTDENGLPLFNFEIYIQEGFCDFIAINGIDLPAKIMDCNVEIVYQAYFYVDSKNYLPGEYSPHQYIEFFSIPHNFTNTKEVFRTSVPFPQEFWNDCCSKSPFLTLENSRQGIYERYPHELYVYNDSYISLSIDYSKFQFI